jgi:amidase
MSDLVFLPAHVLAKGIRERTFSSVEVLQAHLMQIKQHNGKLNAIVTLDEEKAVQKAKEADEAIANHEHWGALHGVPVTIKDYIETAHLRTTANYRPLANYVSKQDATVVSRLRAAGAIILGKTNLPELSQGFQTDGKFLGRANNPWDIACTPGGSSGGGAAAIAAGLSPLEIGGDIGGSIRIPAHFCGIYGLKPTEHRVSNAGCVGRKPGLPNTSRHLRVLGPLARSIEDLRLCLSLIEGEDDRDWNVRSAAHETFSPKPLKEYRFAWMDDFGGIPITNGTKLTLETLVNQLEQLGCTVERASPPNFDFYEAIKTYGLISGAELGILQPTIKKFLYARLASISTLLPGDALSQGLIKGAGASLQTYLEALAKRDDFIRQMNAFLFSWDAWLCPVACGAAFPHLQLRGLFDSAFKTLSVDHQTVPYLVWGITHSPIFNLTGNPVVALPVGKTQAGMPIGIQVVGKRWRDQELLAISQALTEVTGEFQRPSGF